MRAISWSLRCFLRLWVVGTSFHGGVVGSDGNELAGDAAEAGDDAAAGDGLGAVFLLFPREVEVEGRRGFEGFFHHRDKWIERTKAFAFLLRSLLLIPISLNLTIQPVPSERRQLQKGRPRVQNGVMRSLASHFPRDRAHGLCPTALRCLSLEFPHFGDELRHRPGVASKLGEPRLAAWAPRVEEASARGKEVSSAAASDEKEKEEEGGEGGSERASCCSCRAKNKESVASSS